jgi:hypothetical protein
MPRVGKEEPMKVRLIGMMLLVAGLALSAAPASAQVDVPAVRSIRAALAELDGVIATLEDMKRSRHRDRALRQAAEVRTRLVEGLATLVTAAPIVPRTPVVPPRMRPAGPEAMDGQRFGELVVRLGQLAFAKDQMAYLEDVVRHNWFHTDQVRRVMRAFSFDSDKVKAAVLMYPVVLDKREFHVVQQELAFESDRERLRNEVRRIDEVGLDREREVR